MSRTGVWVAAAAAGGVAQAEAADAALAAEPAQGSAAEQPADSDAQSRILPLTAAPESDEAPAIDFSLIYTIDIWANVRGGLRRGWRILDNLDATLTVDAERALGWRDATLFLYGLYNNGEGLSGDLVGDAQGASNIETGVQAARLYEAWVEQRFASDRASIKLGLYDLNSEFDVQETGGLFVTSSHGIGPDFSQSGRNGPSIFPVTSLALRGDYRFSPRWLVRAAVLDAVPGNPARPRRTTIDLGTTQGALAVAEVEHRSGPLRATFGYWRYTARFDDLLATARAGAAVERRGNDGFYLMAERRLQAGAGEAARGLSAWARLGFADRRFNPIGRYLGAGLVYSGPLRGRPNDQAGLAVGWADFAAPYRRALRLQGERSSGAEVSFELTYRAQLTDWLAVQPNLQYIAGPGGNAALRDAVLVGVRTQIGF